MEPRRREPHRRTPAPADAAAAAADGPPAPADAAAAAADGPPAPADAAGAAKDGPPAAASAPARSVSPVRQVLSVGLVSVLAGWLFTWNAGSGPESDLRDAPGLRGMVTARDRQAEQLEDRREELAAEVETLVRAVAASPEQSGPDPALALAAGTAAVKGPGLTITLDDAEAGQDILAEPTAPGADRLVHQEDIDAVLNALWAGGAEAVAVQGHRVGSATAIKCVGNVILVGGRVYSPPYRISAIGPAGEMRLRLDAAPIVRAYRDRAGRLGLTWSAVDEGELEIAGDTPGPSTLRYARAVEPPTGIEEGTGP